MKIVHCLFSMATGGAQILVVDMLNLMCINNEAHLIVVNNEINPSILSGLDGRVKVHCIGRNAGSKNPLPILKLNMLLYGIRPDVIHCHEFNMGRMLRFLNVPKLYTVHDVGIDSKYFHDYSSLTTISRAVYEDVLSRTGIESTIVNNGIPFSSFTRRDKFHLDDGEPFRIIQISRLLHSKKGQDVLVHAIKSIVTLNPERKLILDFVGTGPSETFLKTLVSDLELEQHVRFLGARDRAWVLKNLASYHLLVQPSRYEGFGLTVVEALAAGIPALVSDIDGPKEILKDTSAGFMFLNENVDSCSKQIESIIDLYGVPGVPLASKVEDTTSQLREKFSIDKTCERFQEVYVKLFAERK